MNRHDRSANLATWSVIVGALLGVLLFLGAAYSRQPLAGLVVGIAIGVYMVVLSVVGRINVFHVLWGETVDENDHAINRRVILQATAAVAIGTIGVLLYDLLSSDDWGWFGWLAALVASGYLVSLLWYSRHAAKRPE
jgi:hypothetical protein